MPKPILSFYINHDEVPDHNIAMYPYVPPTCLGRIEGGTDPPKGWTRRSNGM